MTVRELVAALVRFGADTEVCQDLCQDHAAGPCLIRKTVWSQRGTDLECALLTDREDAQDD